MSDDRAKRVRLEGGLQDTSSSIEIVEDGSLKVEFYDFSDEADRMMGGEVLHSIIVAPSEKLRLLELLDLDVDPNAQTDELLLARMKDRFHCYFGVKSWLDEQGVPYDWYSDPFV